MDMNSNSYKLLGVVMLVSALAITLKYFHIWGITETPVAWRGALLLVPIYTLGSGFLNSWKKGKKKKSIYLLQACLLCIVVMVATFYPPLWQYSFIFFVLILALQFFLMAKYRDK